MKLYLYSAVFKGDKDLKPKIILPLSLTYASSVDEVRVIAARLIPEEWVGHLPQVEIMIRDF